MTEKRGKSGAAVGGAIIGGGAGLGIGLAMRPKRALAATDAEKLNTILEDIGEIKQMWGTTSDVLSRLTDVLALLIPAPAVEAYPNLPAYNVIRFDLDTAKTTSEPQEVDLPGDALTFYTDGDFKGIQFALDSPTNDWITVGEFGNPYNYPAQFQKFYVAWTAQTGKYLRVHIGREAGAAAQVQITAEAAREVFQILESDKDSTPSYTPVIIKGRDGFIDVIPISDLSDFQDSISHNGAQLSKLKGLQIYNGHKGWTDIKYISRHYYDGEIVCLGTARGHVHTTPNHSVVNHNGVVNATNLRRGDSVSCSFIRGHNGTIESGGLRSHFFIGTEGLAWLYGLFAAEGSVQRNGERGQVTLIYNKDRTLLEKAEEIARTNLHAKTMIQKPPSAAVSHLSIHGSNLADFFRNSFYTNEKEKKVPKAILNSPANIKKAFLEGYWAGDGCKGHYGRLDVEMCTSVSQALVQGILWLLTSIDPRTYHLSHGHGKNPKTTDIWVNQSADWHDPSLKRNHKVTSVRRSSYKGYVYDIETDSHTFLAGVGGIRLHNTHFTSALAQYAKEDENISGLLYNKLRVIGVGILSDQQLHYKLLLWYKDTFDDTDLDIDEYCAEIDLDIPTYGFQVGGTGIYYMDVRNLHADYHDQDGTNELHASLINMSTTAKLAGATGEVKLFILYTPMA